jgi:hypothetical protein
MTHHGHAVQRGLSVKQDWIAVKHVPVYDVAVLQFQ